MIKIKNLFKLDKNFIFYYFFRFLIINLFGLLFLYDTDSFNQGLISIQSIIYSFSTILTFFFIILEFTFSTLQFYGIDHKFLGLILIDFKSINLNYAYEIIKNILNYILFITSTLIIIYFRDIILSNIYNKKLIFLILVGTLSIMSFNTDFTNKFINKIYNLNSNLDKYSFFRNDNWFLYYKYKTINTPQNIEESKKNYINDFSNLIIPNLYKNIFIIINESYPNFKNPVIKNNLIKYIYDEEMTDLFEIKNYITNWSKEYSTQGAELKLFCSSNSKFSEFKNKKLKDFIKDNNCYFKNFENYNKIFIHSYYKSSFGRGRYDSFFNQTFFYEDLENLKLDTCEGRPFTGYCDHQLVEKLNEFRTKNNNLIIYLTVNNHIPTKLIKNINEEYCKNNFPLNIHDQFCFIYQNQILFNKGLNKFIKTLSKDDLLIYYSDTPPIFPNKHRIHFEDYIDVYTFKKK